MTPDETRGARPLTIDISEALADLIEIVKDDDETVEEYAAHAVRGWVQWELLRNHDYTARVDIPPEAARIGRLRAEDAAVSKGEETNEDDYAADHTSLVFDLPEEVDE